MHNSHCSRKREAIIVTPDNDKSSEPLIVDDPLVGTTVVDRYDITSVIGFGGWSTVYGALDQTLNRQVAIKAMHAHLCTDQSKLLRFQREAQSSSILHHPNIAVVYDSGLLRAGRPYISMELIEGVSLAELNANAQTLEETLAIFTQICDGLEAIHDAGLLHRDLKPGNIKVTENGAAKILDFGCAKWVLQEQNLLTRTDEAVGTPAYMSPEQCMGKPLDARSDIYSFGCVMYEVLTTLRPFASDNLLECMRLHLKSMPPSFKSIPLQRQIPQGFESVVFKTLAKDPDDRFASAKELREALRNCLASGASGAQILEPWRRLGAKRRKQTVFAIIGATALVSTFASYCFQISKSRNLVFPADHSVGAIYTIKKNQSGADIGQTLIGPAQGIVRVPASAYVLFREIHPAEGKTLACLQTMNPTDIQSIDLTGTAPGGEAIKNINTQTTLNAISFNGTKISDTALKQLRSNTLVGIDITNTTVSDETLISLSKNCPDLRWVQAKGNNKITGTGIAALAGKTGFKALLLQDVEGVDDECMSAVGKSPSVDYLILIGDNITDRGVASLVPASMLSRIVLTSTKITNNALKSLSAIHTLRHINVSDTKIDDACIPDLLTMTGLKTLNISSTSISKAGVKQLKSALSQCAIESSE